MTSLPADVIYEIFVAASEIDIPLAADTKLDRAGTLGWIKLTHICRLWRQVGLNISHLWGNILLNLPNAITTILGRAGQAPLMFDIDKMDGVLSRERILRHAGLVGRAAIINDSGAADLRGYVGSFLKFPSTLPHLRSLRLRQPAITMTLRYRDMEAPSLRHCELHLRYFPFTSLPQLTTLKLIEKAERLMHPFWEPLLAILLVCPALERLYVDAAVRQRDEPGPNVQHDMHRVVRALPAAGAVARLPHLTFMKVEMRLRTHNAQNLYDSSQFSALLRRIEIPSSASVFIGCRAARDDNPYVMLVPALSSQLELHGRDALVIAISQSDGMYHTYSRADVPDKRYDVISVSVCPSVETPSTASEEAESGVGFLMDKQIPSEAMARLLESLAAIVAPSICTLMLRDGSRRSALAELSDWKEHDYQELVASGLRPFANVTTVHLRTWTMDGLLLLKDGRGRGLFPELGIVVVDHALAMMDGTATAWWDELAAVLATRRTAGRPVYDLVLRGDSCTFMDPMQDFHVLRVIDERTEHRCACTVTEGRGAKKVMTDVTEI